MITCNAITFDPNHYTHLQEGTIIPAWLQASVICAINCGIGKWRNSLPDLLMLVLKNRPACKSTLLQLKVIRDSLLTSLNCDFFVSLSE